MNRARLLPLAVVTIMSLSACPCMPVPAVAILTTEIAASARLTPPDPEVAKMRQFLQDRNTTVTAAAETVRTLLRLPADRPANDAGGCHGPRLEMETAASPPAADHQIGQALVDLIVADLIDHGPADLAIALVALNAAGGGVRLADQGWLDESTIALSVGHDLIVGARWVHAALQDPSSVHANLAHELSGHMKYDTPMSCLILETALADTPAISDFEQYRAAYLTYVYPETEIYAELHELSHPSDSAIGDDPYIDIVWQVRRLEAIYPPALSTLILNWLRLRCATDPTLSADARYYCDAAVKPTQATGEREPVLRRHGCRETLSMGFAR